MENIKNIELFKDPFKKSIGKFFPEIPNESLAISSQWCNSLATRCQPFGSQRGIERELLFRSIRKDSNYISCRSFKERYFSSINISPPLKPKFTFVDLFAGIGGMRIGIQNAGGHCVFSSEIDQQAQKTYLDNYGEMPFGDITKINPLDVPHHDLLVAGFPCQPFSNAGLKKGIDDTRGTLLYNIARILRAKKPKVVLLENVKGLIGHDNGKTISIIFNTLLAEGYACGIGTDLFSTINVTRSDFNKMVLKSKDFGLPQNRQRIYMVLWRSDIDQNFQYPNPLNIKTKVSQILESNVDSKYTLSDQLWEGHMRRKRQNKINGKGFGYGIVSSDSTYTNTISSRYYKDGSEILLEQENSNPRMLTPREAARLQGFPDKFILNPSDMQAYKQFGNSVSVPVIEALANSIYNQLLS